MVIKDATPLTKGLLQSGQQAPPQRNRTIRGSMIHTEQEATNFEHDRKHHFKMMPHLLHHCVVICSGPLGSLYICHSL